MASPTFESVGVNDIATGTPRSPAIPTGVVNGSFVLVVEGISSNGDRTGNTSGGAGTWAEFVKSLNTSGSFMVDWKVATGTDSTPGTYSTPAHATLLGKTAALRFSGVHPTVPFHATTNSATGSTSTIPTVSLASLPECTIVVLYQSQSSGSTTNTITTPPSIGGTPMTQRDANTPGQFHFLTHEWAGGSATASGGVTNNGPANRAFMFALLPSSAPAITEDVIIGGAKKTVTVRSEMTAGAKKTVPTASVIIGGAKKTTV